MKISDARAELLVRENIGWMIPLASRMLQDRQLAEDVVQESLINAFQSLESFEGRSSLKTWLHRITVNIALAKLRKMKRLEELNVDYNLAEYDRYECRIESRWENLVSIQEVLESDSLSALVRQKISALDDPLRIILQLRDIEGYDTDEVADLMGLSKSNVRVRLHRARAALKIILEPLLRGEMAND
ncbi:MAG: RNA polymerase sigma-70 factor (ECF subfamily) [Oleiphilaceae bacterium]